MHGAITFGGEVFELGPAVRLEYLKLPGDLVALLRSFRIDLPQRHLRDAVVLTFSIECVDRWLDGIETSGQRTRFGLELMDYLQGRRPGGSCDFGEELSGWLLRLREVMERRRVAEPYCKIINKLLRNSEEMRAARTTAGFVECALREGRLMVELLLLIIGDSTTARFNDFMRHLSEPANLIDKIRDARRDYARRELAIEPGLYFRMRLSYELFRRVLGLARFGPVNLRLLAWGLRALCTEVRIV